MITQSNKLGHASLEMENWFQKMKEDIQEKFQDLQNLKKLNFEDMNAEELEKPKVNIL